MVSNVMFTSERDDWETPTDLFRKLNDEFHFTVDLCASDENHKCPKYYTKENDGMAADLTGEVVYCNPPYGSKATLQWAKKCAEAKATVVMLLPARTDTRAFHDYIYNKAEVRFLRGRLKFTRGGGNPQQCPVPVNGSRV